MKLVLGFLLVVGSASGSAVIVGGTYIRNYPPVDFIGVHLSYSFTLSDGYSLSGFSQIEFVAAPKCDRSLGPCSVGSGFQTLGVNIFDNPTLDNGFLDQTSPAFSFPVSFTTGERTFVVPFSVSGYLSTAATMGNRNPLCDLPTPDSFSSGMCTENITGQGFEEITVGLTTSGNLSYYNVESMVFTFVPAPEPGSLAMLWLFGIPLLVQRVRNRIGITSRTAPKNTVQNGRGCFGPPPCPATVGTLVGVRKLLLTMRPVTEGGHSPAPAVLL